MVCGPDLQLLLEQLNLHAAREAAGLVPFHAAAVETPAGVIALAGPSGTGKSTLCAIAVLAGHGYVADEIAAVHPDTLAVRAFHRPIGLRAGAADALGIEHRLHDPDCGSTVHPWTPDADRCSPGGTLVGIAIVSRRPQPDTPESAPIRTSAVRPDADFGEGRRPGPRIASIRTSGARNDAELGGEVGAGEIEDVAPVTAMVELLQHTVIPDDQLTDAFHGLDRIVRRVPAVRAAYDTPDDGRTLIERLVQRWR